MNVTHPAVIIAYGRPRSGKTSAMKYNILRRLTSPTPPDAIYVMCSPATKNDGSYNYIPQDYVVCTEFEKCMKEIIKGQEVADPATRRKLLVVLDDITGLLKWQEPIWTHAITNTAHHDITYLCGVHMAQKTSTIFRESCTEAWIFHQQTKPAITSLFNSYGNTKFDYYEQFRSYLRDAIKDEKSHIFIRYKPSADDITKGMNDAQKAETEQFLPMIIPWPIPDFTVQIPEPPKKKQKKSENENNKGKDEESGEEEAPKPKRRKK